MTHEQLDSVCLVYMNGRVFDPEIGRFLSADPFIQDATNSQALNAYSYVLNNPLSFTDPSGFFFSKLFRAIGKFFKAIIAAAISFAQIQVYTRVGTMVADRAVSPARRRLPTSRNSFDQL